MAMAKVLVKARLAAASIASAAASIAAIARGVPSPPSSRGEAPSEASRRFWRGVGEQEAASLAGSLYRRAWPDLTWAVSRVWPMWGRREEGEGSGGGRGLIWAGWVAFVIRATALIPKMLLATLLHNFLNWGCYAYQL